MSAVTTELHLMKVHIFESEAARAQAAAAGLIGENDLVLTPETGDVDSVMSDESTAPVQNRVVKQYIDAAIAAVSAAG